MALSSYSDFKFENHPSILDASSIVIAAASQCHRMVVRKLSEMEYVTHLETVSLDGDTWKHNSFMWGHYFNAASESKEDKDKALSEAIKDYGERVRKMW